MEMTDLEMWSMLSGAVAPFLIALIVQSKWSDRTNALVGGLVILLTALGTAYFAGNLGNRDAVSALLVVFVTAATTHSHLWSPLGWYDKVNSGSSKS